MNNLTIVAVANESPSHDYLVRGFEAFLKSSRKYKHDPVVLGWGVPWKGLGCKPKLLKRAVEDGTIKTKKIIFADAYDVWFASHPDAILEASLEFTPSRIVWNAEKNCFPDALLAESFPDKGTSFRYLNSGLSVGDTEAYLECLREMEVDSWPDDHMRPDGSWFHKNDQDDWMRRFLFGQCAGQVPMSLDTGCSMFQTLTGMSVDDFEFGASIKNKETGSEPLAFHANGGSKTSGVMEPILKHLNM